MIALAHSIISIGIPLEEYIPGLGVPLPSLTIMATRLRHIVVVRIVVTTRWRRWSIEATLIMVESMLVVVLVGRTIVVIVVALMGRSTISIAALAIAITRIVVTIVAVVVVVVVVVVAIATAKLFVIAVSSGSIVVAAARIQFAVNPSVLTIWMLIAFGLRAPSFRKGCFFLVAFAFAKIAILVFFVEFAFTIGMRGIRGIR
jgi:hypothetical protein